MLKSIFKYVFLIGLAFACNNVASSRFEVVNQDSDNISDMEKIRIFEASTSSFSGPAYAAIANLYANEGDYIAALETVHEAVLQDPMNSFYHTLKSNYSFETGDISTAYREALTAYQLGSKSLEQSLILARMGVALSEYSIVDDIIDSLVLVYPSDPEVVFMAARKFEKSGQIGQAIDQYQKGIELNPEDVENYYYLASLYFSLDNERSALKTLENYTLNNIEARSALIKAESFAKSGKLDSATTYFEYLLMDGRDSSIYNKLIRMYRFNELRDNLVNISIQAADSFPDNKYFLKNAADVLDDRYKYDLALVYTQQLFELDTLDTLVAQQVSVLQRKIAYLQRKKKEERMENAIPTRRVTFPSLDSLNKD